MNGGKIFLTLQENDDCIKKQTDNLSVCFLYEYYCYLSDARFDEMICFIKMF